LTNCYQHQHLQSTMTSITQTVPDNAGTKPFSVDGKTAIITGAGSGRPPSPIDYCEQ
jgi:hypothetical protein